MLSFVLLTSYAYAYTNEEIVNAIRLTEGGSKAVYAYGIRSVHYKDEAEAREIAFRTVANNRVRFKNQTKYKDYINFLSSRYAPLNAKNDPKGLNKNWTRNLRYFLKKGE